MKDMNAYAFCVNHANRALTTLIKEASSSSPHFKIGNVSGASNFRCSCGKRAKFFIREVV